MTDIVSLITIGISAFVATNIDDIFVLMLFFSPSSVSSSLKFTAKQVVLGQYIGIGMLVAISALDSFLPLVVPPYIIGLLGIVPIIIGVKKLVQILRKADKVISSKQAAQEKSYKKYEPYLSFLTVAAVTFSNGGDNIGVYIPMFAQYKSASQITTLVTVLMIMTAVWCAVAYYLVNHLLIASRIRHVGHIILPFVLIALGIYILAEFFL
jgi:cadmium resistance protein CadD (predicted permease)